jgi:hypothetical protein
VEADAFKATIRARLPIPDELAPKTGFRRSRAGVSRDIKTNPQALTLSACIWYDVQVVPVSFSFVQQQPSHFCGFPPLVLA